MKIFNKEISIFDFLPYIFFRIHRQYKSRRDEWRKWQNPATPILVWHGEILDTYSQFGEDIILSEIFRDQPTGRFLDVSANHPKELNNTYKLYKKGWRGVNVEPGNKMFDLLQQVRPDDKTLQVGVGKNSGQATFYEMDVDSISTFNLKAAHNSEYGKNIISSNQVKIITLAQIFEAEFYSLHCDLLSINVEGDNFEVLEGNDWARFRPSYIVIEMPGQERTEIVPYLYRQGYFLVYDNSLNGIFKDSGLPGPHNQPKTLQQCLNAHTC
jgi:FkbM family methyltransferase